MSLTCEISGEPIATSRPGDEVVVTPSGHICFKRLLLQKLAENGGQDPFEQELPLSEGQLITLRSSNSSTASTNGTNTKIPPPRPQATSLPNLLHLMQTEYDALVLELFDTRKALEETRRELSQALYQNDAAVRVVARLSMERDAARQELEQWNASANIPNNNNNHSAAAATTTTTTNGHHDTTVAEPTSVHDGDEPQSKRQKLQSTTTNTDHLPLKNDLPSEDLNAMVETWQQLHPQRKPMLKAAAANALSPEVVASFAKKDTKAWHKSTCRSVLVMAHDQNMIVTASKDKQVVIYSGDQQVVLQTITLAHLPKCVDIDSTMVVVADTNGTMAAYLIADGAMLATIKLLSPAPSNDDDNDEVMVNVQIHPTGKHVCVATSKGRVIVVALYENDTDTDGGTRFQPVAEFQSTDDSSVEYTCGSIHPDGLLYAAGTNTGKIHMWDFKNKVLASTLQEGEEEDAVTAIAFSNNGYHLATGHASHKVHFWDLRKQKTIATVNQNTDDESSSSSWITSPVTAIAFDESGKYAVLGGGQGGDMAITTVKDWKLTTQLVTSNPKSKGLSGVVWTPSSGIVCCSPKERQVTFYGPP